MSDSLVASEELARVNQLKDLARQALDAARAQGATSAEAGCSASTGLSVNVRMGDVETIEHTRDKGLGVTVFFGHKKGSASTTDFSEAAVAETVRAACSIAGFTAEDECAGLADAERMASHFPDLDLYHPWTITADRAIEIALEAENAARAVDERITNSEGAGVNHHEGAQAYANSHGFVGGYLGTRHSISASVIAEDADGMQRDYWYSVARRADALEAAADIGRISAERSLRRLGARPVDTCSVPVLYAAEVSGGLFRHFVNAVRGSNLYRESTFLLDQMGKPVFSDFVRVHEQPHLPGALGSASFDSEGVATVARDLVTDGVLNGYVLGSYAARKLGLETTGNAGGVHNLTVEPGPSGLDLDGLIGAMGTGLLVTEMMGMGVNITTGDYSRGAGGYWVENGEITHPVEGVTIAGNLRDMFLDIREIGTDVDLRGNVRAGSVLLGAMTVAGT